MIRTTLACVVLAVGVTSGTALCQPTTAASEAGLGSAQASPGAATVPGATAVPGASTLPASRPTSRPRLVIPPGFSRVDIGTRHVLVEPADEPWVRAAIEKLGTLPPATRPSTLPADLLATLEARSDELVGVLAADLAIDKAKVVAWRDEVLKKSLAEFDSAPVEVVCLITTRPRLKELMRAGWESPAMKYNRAADEVFFSDAVVLAGDLDSADALVPVIYDAPASPASAAALEAREKVVVDGYQNLDQFVLRAKGQRGQFLLQAALLRFIGDQALGTGEISPDQEWLRVGVTGVLTAKYTSMLSGVPRRAIVQAMTSEPRRGFRSNSIDLLAPLDPATMRREAVMPYADALRRKSVRVVDDLVLQHGDAVLPRILEAVRAKKPGNGQAQVELIREVTTTDVSAWLRPG